MRNLTEKQEDFLRAQLPYLARTRSGQENHLISPWAETRTICGRSVIEEIPWPKREDEEHLCEMCLRSFRADWGGQP
jgi:hypothetical protein